MSFKKIKEELSDSNPVNEVGLVTCQEGAVINGSKDLCSNECIVKEESKEIALKEEVSKEFLHTEMNSSVTFDDLCAKSENSISNITIDGLQKDVYQDKFSYRMDDIKLIELVRTHKCLYDAKDEHYKDVQIRENVWKKISDEMKQPAAECKNRWRSVRDTFMRHRRNKKLPTSSSRAKKLRKWHLEGYLQFLLHVENERQTVTNTQQCEIQSDNQEDEVTADQSEELEPNIQENNEIETENLEQNEIIEEEQSLVGLDIGEKQRKQQKSDSGNKKNTSDKILDLFQKNSRDRKEFFKKALEKWEEAHPVDLFFNSMASSVKKLSMERQIRAKMQISQIVGQLELEEYASRPSSSMSTHSHCTSPNEPFPFPSVNKNSTLHDSFIMSMPYPSSENPLSDTLNYSLNTNMSGTHFQ